MNYFREEYGSTDFYYKHFYAESRGCASSFPLKFLSSYPHRLMESNHRSNSGKKILELGFGRGEHLEFEMDDFDSYIGVDLRTFKDTAELRNPRVRLLKGDAEVLEFADSSFDRVIVTCLLAHLANPEKALLEWRRVAKERGDLTIYLPADPGLSLRVFRRLVSKKWATRNGFEGYDLFIAREHRNSFSNLKVLIHEIFYGSEIVFKSRPFPGLGWYVNLFAIVEIKLRK